MLGGCEVGMPGSCAYSIQAFKPIRKYLSLDPGETNDRTGFTGQAGFSVEQQKPVFVTGETVVMPGRIDH